MNYNAKIYVAGHNGMVGSAIVRSLKKAGYTNFVFRTRQELDLTKQKAVEDFFSKEKPDYVFLAAARVGGVYANNTYRAEFIYENLIVELNVIHAAWKAQVERLLFLGSSCIYPRNCKQPIIEDYLLSGTLEPTNEPYAVAKIAGIKLCESYNRQYGTKYVSAMPTNLYGPNDNYDLKTSHVLPALIRKAHDAKKRQDPNIVIWGTGNPRREFLYVDDLADACVFLMEHEINDGVYNIGCGEDYKISQIAKLIMDLVGYAGEMIFDTTKPDGMPQKLLNVDKMSQLGWQAKISLLKGLEKTYQDFMQREEIYTGADKKVVEHAS